MQRSQRNANLDLLRALAILAVVAFHMIGTWPGALPGVVTRHAYLGAYGVDLFFVLSGWLIGGLYWAERKRFGNVQIGRFWLRRWLRTIPPYLAALLLAWLAVYLYRREPFRPLYLVFLQNYLREIPYFQVSWSLCVEEHFYVLLPIALVATQRFRRARHVIYLLAVLIPLVLRYQVAAEGANAPFGYYKGATQFRFEGLVLGVWCACVSIEHPDIWPKLERACRWLLVPAALLLATIPLWTEVQRYIVGYSVIALGFTTFLVALVHWNPLWIATRSATFWIANTSYSVYLTHALAIHTADALTRRITVIPLAVWLPTWLAMIAVSGYVFYQATEATSIRLRDRWVPRRGRAALAEAARANAPAAAAPPVAAATIPVPRDAP
jgi:peptidoglycan/LPS O-acetylase OafA/YrhL